MSSSLIWKAPPVQHCEQQQQRMKAQASKQACNARKKLDIQKHEAAPPILHNHLDESIASLQKNKQRSKCKQRRMQEKQDELSTNTQRSSIFECKQVFSAMRTNKKSSSLERIRCLTSIARSAATHCMQASQLKKERRA